MVWGEGRVPGGAGMSAVPNCQAPDAPQARGGGGRAPRATDTDRPTWVLPGKGGDVVDDAIDHHPSRGAGAVRRHLSQGEGRHAAASSERGGGAVGARLLRACGARRGRIPQQRQGGRGGCCWYLGGDRLGAPAALGAGAGAGVGAPEGSEAGAWALDSRFTSWTSSWRACNGAAAGDAAQLVRRCERLD